MFLKKDALGYIIFIKKSLIFIIGLLTYKWFKNEKFFKIKGTQNILNLPKKNVFFISNHQTYFADGIAILHVLNAALNGQNNSLKNPFKYLRKMKVNIYYVAAKTTMKSKLISKILEYTGSISIERPWVDKKSKAKTKDISNISKALKNGWVIFFPQGTTQPNAPIRKGTGIIIKKNKPIIVPIIIDGFSNAFYKKKLGLKNKSVIKNLTIKKPIYLDFKKESSTSINQKVTDIILEKKL